MTRTPTARPSTGRDRAWLGLDVGTQGVRVTVVDEAGRRLGSGAADLPAGTRDGARHEQDPSSWWDAAVPALRAALTAAGPVDLQAMAVDATSGTVLVEDADGRPVGPALMYDDSRAAEQTARAVRAGSAAWDAAGYRMQPSWALPKVLWLLDEDVVPRGGRIAHQSDHVARRLTGSATATDTSNALKTGADLVRVAWPQDVFADLAIAPGVLPDLVLPGTPLGRVGADAAAATGLPEGLPVVAGMTDGCAAQIAAGAVEPGTWSSALGTTLVLKGSSATLVRDAGGAVYSHRNPDGGWLPGGASSTGAGALRAAFPDATPADLDDLGRRAAELGVPTAVTYPMTGRGQRFPFVAPDAEAFGEIGGSDVARFSALCHGIAYVERLAYDVLTLAGADTSGPVAVSGGTARNVWWTQLRADVLARTVVVPAAVEAATGMAVLAAAPRGELGATARRMVRVERVHEPTPTATADLEAGYRKLVTALAERGWLSDEIATAVTTTAGARR